METIATGLQELSINNEELPLSVHTVVSNDDLLNEILLRLPVISLVRFKSISKRWLSFIKDAMFIKRRSQIPKIDPPCGLFVDLLYYKFGSEPFDIRISWNEKIFKTVLSSGTTLLQSCNGLFLCFVVPGYRFSVYNPTLNLFKVLPEPLYYEPKVNSFTRMAFDPTKSPHYKVVHTTPIGQYNRFRIQTYSSETSIWSIVCIFSNPLPVPFSCYFGDAIYWNDAINWIHNDYQRCLHYKLDFANKFPVLRRIQLPVTVDNYYCKLFESRGCLLLLGKGKTNYDQLNIYEIRNGHPEWTLKYFVNYWRICSYGDNYGHPAWNCMQGVSCIALGESEEDSFMVIILDGKVFLYKFVLKTPHELPKLLSILPEKRVYKDSFLFTASFASV